MSEYDKAVDLKNEIKHRIADLIDSNNEDVFTSILLVAIDVLALKHPASITKEDKALILQNHNEATDQLISERALSELGIGIAIAGFHTMAKIVIDYCPLSNVKSEMDSDFKKPEELRFSASQECIGVLENARAKGLSEFGALAIIIHTAVAWGAENGVSPYKTTRNLLDAVSGAMRGLKKSQEEIDEILIETLRGSMGISRAEAKKYIALSKSLKAKGL